MIKTNISGIEGQLRADDGDLQLKLTALEKKVRLELKDMVSQRVQELRQLMK